MGFCLNGFRDQLIENYFKNIYGISKTLSNEFKFIGIFNLSLVFEKSLQLLQSVNGTMKDDPLRLSFPDCFFCTGWDCNGYGRVSHCEVSLAIHTASCPSFTLAADKRRKME